MVEWTKLPIIVAGGSAKLQWTGEGNAFVTGGLRSALRGSAHTAPGLGEDGPAHGAGVDFAWAQSHVAQHGRGAAGAARTQIKRREVRPSFFFFSLFFLTGSCFQRFIDLVTLNNWSLFYLLIILLQEVAGGDSHDDFALQGGDHQEPQIVDGEGGVAVEAVVAQRPIFRYWWNRLKNELKNQIEISILLPVIRFGWVEVDGGDDSGGAP